MKHWEYDVIMNHGISYGEILSWKDDLNRRGADGWELVSVMCRPEVPAEEGEQTRPHSSQPRIVVFLKRKRR